MPVPHFSPVETDKSESCFRCKKWPHRLKSCTSAAGLPDGIFSDQKIAILVHFGGPCNEDVNIFYGYLIRGARWCIFKPIIPIWVNFGGPWNGKCWYIL
jgi:hypothetical protein